VGARQGRAARRALSWRDASTRSGGRPRTWTSRRSW
jgi:hypothetical protein